MNRLPKKFRAKFEINEDGCWMWKASTNTKGYGHYWHEQKVQRIHRLTYTWFIGPIPNKKVIDHYRMNEGPRNAPCSRACCNPAHLEIVTVGENTSRGNSNTLAAAAWHSNKTHCPQGHEYSDENTYTYYKANGDIKQRLCKTCTNRRAKDYQKTKK